MNGLSFASQAIEYRIYDYTGGYYIDALEIDSFIGKLVIGKNGFSFRDIQFGFEPTNNCPVIHRISNSSTYEGGSPEHLDEDNYFFLLRNTTVLFLIDAKYDYDDLLIVPYDQFVRSILDFQPRTHEWVTKIPFLTTSHLLELWKYGSYYYSTASDVILDDILAEHPDGESMANIFKKLEHGNLMFDVESLSICENNEEKMLVYLDDGHKTIEWKAMSPDREWAYFYFGNISCKMKVCSSIM